MTAIYSTSYHNRCCRALIIAFICHFHCSFIFFFQFNIPRQLENMIFNFNSERHYYFPVVCCFRVITANNPSRDKHSSGHSRITMVLDRIYNSTIWITASHFKGTTSTAPWGSEVMLHQMMTCMWGAHL